MQNVQSTGQNPEEPLAGAGDFPQSSQIGRTDGVLTGSSRLRRERDCVARCGLSFLSAGNYAPCGVRGLCGAMVRCFGYDKIAIEFSYIDKRKQSRRSLVPLGFRHISSCTQSRPSVSPCAPLCEPLTDRGELYPRVRCVCSGLSCVLSGFARISDEP